MWPRPRAVEALSMHNPDAYGVGASAGFASAGGGWAAEGFVAYFALEDVSQDVDLAMQVVARRYGQPCVVKWWPHVWGDDPGEHATVMQTLVPAAGGLARIARDGPTWIAEGV